MKPYSWILKSFTWCGFWRLRSCFAGWTLCASASSPSSLKTINCSFTSALKRHRLATNFYHAAYIVTAYHPLYPPLCTLQWYVHPLHHYGRTYNTIQTLSLSTIWCILRPLHHPLPDRYAPGAFENSFDHDELMKRKADKISEYKRKDVLILSAEWYNEGESSLGVVQTPNTNCPVISWVIFN